MLGFNLGRMGVAVAAREAMPTGPVAIFSADPALSSDDDGNQNCNFRIVCTLSESMQDEFRVTIQPGGVGFDHLTSSHVAAGIWTGDADAPSSSVPFVEVLFGESTGFVNKAISQTSDWKPVGALAGLQAGDKVIVSYNTGGSGQSSQKYAGSSTNATCFFKADTSVWGDQAPSGFSKSVGNNFCVVSIETRTPGTPASLNTVPMSFDDAMFTDMTELVSPITLVAGENEYRKSIVEQTGNPSITLGNGSTVILCRVDSRESARISNGTIDRCYLESTGSIPDLDHADTIQVYDPGARGNTVTIKNTHVVAHTDAATAGMFVADDWGGTLIYDNVFFNGGPWGLIIKSDPGCHIDISLDGVYFVGPFGDEGGPYYVQDVGTGTHKISNWTDVYAATIENGVLIPGAAIPAPAFTPRQLDPVVWLEPARGGLFQSNAGTTAASANSDVVGYIADLSGNANHYTSEADNTTRPALQGVGTKPCLRFDGSNDFLMRTESLGLLSGGAYTLAFAFKSNTPATDARLFTEGNTASNNTLFIPIQAHNPTATTSSALYRNDAGTQLVSPSSMTNANVFDNTDKVFILTDDGAFIRSYVNGVTGASTGWTPSGAFTLDRSSIGCLLRAAAGNWWAGDFYGMVAIPRVLTDLERASLRTYMGNLAGLSI